MGAKQLYINGIGTGTYGIYISSDTYLNAPAPDYVAHPIPGRNGDLLQWNKRLNNIARKFTCYIPDQAQSNMDGFKKLLYTSTGYLEISSDYEPDTYQRGYIAEEIDAEPFQSEDVLRVTFTLIFSCEPQKYFKSNTSETISWTRMASWFANIFPRSNALIRGLFQQIPQSDVPDGDAFAVMLISPGLTTEGDIFSNAQFSMPGYEGFVAMVVGRSAYVPKIAQLTEVAGYSTNGVIDNPSWSYTNDDMYNGIAVILPAEAVGTWTASVTRTGGATYSASLTMASQGNLSNEDAIGLHYSLTINGEYGMGGSTAEENNAINVLMVGTLSGKQTFAGLITLDTTTFRNLAESGETYDVSVIIDTEDLSSYAIFDGEKVKISDGIGVWGDIDGIADEIGLYCYRNNQSLHAVAPFFYDSFDISPRWWKV